MLDLEYLKDLAEKNEPDADNFTIVDWLPHVKELLAEIAQLREEDAEQIARGLTLEAERDRLRNQRDDLLAALEEIEAFTFGTRFEVEDMKAIARAAIEKAKP